MTMATSEPASTRPDYTRRLAGRASLAGRAAFVPGGYGGIGEAIAWGLALAGARVAVAGQSAAKAEAPASTLRAAGHEAIGLALDAAAIHFDGLGNCFGIQREERHAEVSEAAFDEVVQVNLKAAMFLSQAVARHQIAAATAGRDGGRQVHVLSVRAQLGMRDRGYSAYCATKGALVMLIKQHAVELSAHGITVNGVAPTVVRGDMGAHWLAEPEDVVGATLFFCSPAAAFVTGQVLTIDGGLTATQ